MSTNSVDRREPMRVNEQASAERREVVWEDVNARNRIILDRISALIGFLFMVLEGVIGLRVLLKLMGANPQNIFASVIYHFTAYFLTPFNGLTINPASGGMVLEITSIMAMIVYALIAWAIIRLLWLVFYQPRPPSVTTYGHNQPPRVS
jgi:YGGT family